MQNCPSPGCVLMDFHIGPHSNDRVRKLRQSCRRTPVGPSLTLTKKARRKTISKVPRGSIHAEARGGKGHADYQNVLVAEVETYVSSDEDIVEVAAVEVEDELMDTRLRVWWPAMQEWYIGDVIAYRKEEVAKTKKQHYIPYDAHLVKYLDGDERWHAFWDPSEVFIIVSSVVQAVHPSTPGAGSPAKFCIMCRTPLAFDAGRCHSCQEVQ